MPPDFWAKAAAGARAQDKANMAAMPPPLQFVIYSSRNEFLAVERPFVDGALPYSFTHAALRQAECADRRGPRTTHLGRLVLA